MIFPNKRKQCNNNLLHCFLYLTFTYLNIFSNSSIINRFFQIKILVPVVIFFTFYYLFYICSSVLNAYFLRFNPFIFSVYILKISATALLIALLFYAYLSFLNIILIYYIFIFISRLCINFLNVY